MKGEIEFEEWYSRDYRRVLASLVAAAGNVDLGREVTDEAFVRAVERWEHVGSMVAPTAWVYTVGLNLLRRAVRRRKMEETVMVRRAQRDDRPPDTLAVEVWDVIRGLPPRQREALALRYLGGLTEAQVARTMGVSNGTVARLLHDGRGRLESLISPIPID